jgi:predicted DNA-binding transcriptional regulator YafY
MTLLTVGENKAVRIVYTNYRGETGERRIIPKRIWFGATEWHPQAQWLVEAFDLDRQAERSFALSEIHELVEEPASTI